MISASARREWSASFGHNAGAVTLSAPMTTHDRQRLQLFYARGRLKAAQDDIDQFNQVRPTVPPTSLQLALVFLFFFKHKRFRYWHTCISPVSHLSSWKKCFALSFSRDAVFACGKKHSCINKCMEQPGIKKAQHRSKS